MQQQQQRDLRWSHFRPELRSGEKCAKELLHETRSHQYQLAEEVEVSAETRAPILLLCSKCGICKSTRAPDQPPSASPRQTVTPLLSLHLVAIIRSQRLIVDANVLDLVTLTFDICQLRGYALLAALNNMSQDLVLQRTKERMRPVWQTVTAGPLLIILALVLVI
eukprot:scaffold3640_cov201-Alexandrium_tamarense.AAC.22